jgi:hypothetical protein
VRHQEICRTAPQTQDTKIVAPQVDQARLIESLRQQIEALTRQVAGAYSPTFQQTIIAGTIVQKPVTINNCTINAWNSKDRLVVSLDLLKAAFRENVLLREYSESPEKNRLDPAFMTRYVLEALMAVIRQAHSSPDSRNIRLNPSRADQVQVLVREGAERWEILSLIEAVRLLFREAAGRITSLAKTAEAHRDLAPAEQIASLLLPQEYQRQPDKYEREGKGRMAAHLASLDTKTVTLPSGRAEIPEPKQKATIQRATGTAVWAMVGSEAPTSEAATTSADQLGLDTLLESLDEGSNPEGSAPPPQAQAGPQLPPRPPPFSPAAAADLLRAHPPALDAEDRAPPSALRRLEAASGQDPARIINHLWDAKEEGLLSAQEQLWAAALTRLHDEAA